MTNEILTDISVQFPNIQNSPTISEVWQIITARGGDTTFQTRVGRPKTRVGNLWRIHWHAIKSFCVDNHVETRRSTDGFRKILPGQAQGPAVRDMILLHEMVETNDPELFFAAVGGAAGIRMRDAFARGMVILCPNPEREKRTQLKTGCLNRHVDLSKRLHTAEEIISLREEIADRKKRAKLLKRPAGSFFLFSAKLREELKEERPELKGADFAKEAGRRWRCLSLEEKQPFVDQANETRIAWKLKKDAILTPERNVDDPSVRESNNSEDDLD